MFFRNLTVYRVSPAVAQEVLTVDEKLSEHKLRPVGPMEMSTRGFVSPFGDAEGLAMSLVSRPFVLMKVGHQNRMLPGSVINTELRKRVNKIVEEEGRKVGGKERKRLKEDLIMELLPKAFVNEGANAFYVDTKGGWVVCDASSTKSAENSITALREALGSFPAVPLAPEESPRILLTDWVSKGVLPEGLYIGSDCELKEPGDSKGATIRAKNQDLAAEEIKEHLRAGKQVTKLGLTYKERISFTLDENLVIGRLKFLDVAMESMDQGGDGAANELEATFALMTLEVLALLDDLAKIFKLPLPEDDAK
jgi:recombination associated protein RdgC